MAIKTDNQIWAFLIGKITAFIQDKITSGDTRFVDWIVTRTYQPTIQGLRAKTIYINKISDRRIGVQGSIDTQDEDGNWQTADTWFEEKLIQISGFLPRNTETETKDTATSGDIIREIMAYINSASKVQEWKSDGYEVIRSTDMRDIDYVTDSGLNEKFPQFDFLLCVEQISLKKIEKVDTIEITTKRI